VNKFDDTFSRFYTVPACDGPTDRQTSFDIVIHAMHTNLAVKTD